MAIALIEWPTTKALEISSRSASVNASLERRRSGGRIPPVSERILWTDEWKRSNIWAIWWSVHPSFQRSHISTFWLSE
jgi:hypothetical protein